MSPALSQGPDGKLERATGHVRTVVFHTHGVHTGLGGYEADAVGVVLPLHDVSLVHLSRRAGDLRRHVRYADLYTHTHTMSFCNIEQCKSILVDLNNGNMISRNGHDMGPFKEYL